MKTIIRFNLPYVPKLASAILLSSLSLGSAMGLLATSAWLISEASTRPPVLVLEVAIVAVRTFGLSRGLLKYVSRIVEHDVALKTQTNLRSRIYENLRLLPSLRFGEFHRGQVLQELVQDVDATQDLWLRLWNPWFSALITGVAGIGIIYALVPAYALCLSLLFLIAMAAAPLVALISQSSAHVRDEEGELFDHVMQSFQGVDESLIFGYQEHLLADVREKQSLISHMDRRAARWAGVASAGYAKALGISLILGVLFASSAFARGEISGVNVAVLILLPLAIFDGASTLPLAFSRALRIRESINAIEPLLIEPALKNPETELQHGFELEVTNLAPKIPGKALPAFTGIARPGSPWIVTGASGYGKSSLFFALIGFIEYSGSISLDKNKIQKLSQQSTAVLLQDDHLFLTSIRENLKIGKPDATDDELEEILRFVELGHLLERLADGLDTLIGEAGFNFSGGEKQRMKLARVLLREADIYLLDEPFEFIGLAQAERLSKKVFDRLAKKTVVVVSHLEVESTS